MTVCANGCLHPITAEDSNYLTPRAIGGGLVIYEHRHLSCTPVVYPPAAITPE